MKTKRFLSILLSLVLVLGMLPGMSLTASAEGNTTEITPTNTSGTMTITLTIAAAQAEELLTTITATGKEQASYNPENVASVSFSYSSEGSSAYSANWGWWGYGWSATVNAAEGYTITKCVFYDDQNHTATDSEASFVVETTEEDKTPKVNGTPILAYTSKGIKKIEVYGYATPAATHSVTITAGDHMTKTADSGEASQTDLTGAMTDVVYTADNGYYYPTDYSVAEVSGIKVTRDSYTQITVSGTPTADAAIALTAPTAKTTPDAPTTATATDCTTADNNDGTLTGVTTAMEYKKSDAADWTAGTGSDITGLVPGTYYVRVKATDTTNASGNQELTIKGFISYTVTFKVVNGKWNEGEGDAATADKTVTLTGHDGDTLKLTADQIPAVGTKPNDTYKVGSWDTTPSADTEIAADTTYTYTYAQKDAISQTVTFKVVNGSWNDETTTDKTVTLTGYEGDTLKLAANQIPAVGTKPNDTYKAGSWDVTPSAETEITAATTYTYTYAQKDTISQTVTFKVANGSWNDETTADKTVTLTGYEGDTLKLTADQIPTVGTKPNNTYKAGSWDVTPSTDTAITEATTYTYIYVAKEASLVTKAPEAKTLTYNGQAQELVTAGTATGGEMQYALGNATEATGHYTTSIPTETNAGTYYVWYKAVGDSDHSDSEAKAITVDIRKKTDSHTHDIRLVESKEPTCTGNGYKEHYECTECEAWFQDRTGVSEITDKSGYTIKAIGHKWGAYEVTKRPTYDEEGLKVCTCENDPSHTKEETIPKLTSSSSSDSDSDSGSSGGSGSKNNNVSKQVIDVNGNVKSNVPSNHQVESGVPASDVGGRWANSADADTWTYTKSDGTLAKSEWMSLDYNGLRYWYYFDASGNMQTNWFDYNGKKFYLMPDKDGWRGRMATGWKKIDNKWYYFDITPGETQGSMYTAAITPDGHTVGADGAWNGVGATPVGQE